MSRRAVLPPAVLRHPYCHNAAVSDPTNRARMQQDNPATHRVNQPQREEGIVREGAEPVQHEVPEMWGWHGEMGKWGRRLVIFPILALIAFQFGNHRGHVETIWLGCLTFGLIVWVFADVIRRKNAWRAK